MEHFKVDYIKFNLGYGADRYTDELMNRDKLIRLLKDGMVTVRSAKRVMNCN